ERGRDGGAVARRAGADRAVSLRRAQAGDLRPQRVARDPQPLRTQGGGRRVARLRHRLLPRQGRVLHLPPQFRDAALSHRKGSQARAASGRLCGGRRLGHDPEARSGAEPGFERARPAAEGGAEL
ncbi:MAG: FIG00450577: hypothetical protein, partial [uncultured Microvirga sp.]